MPHLEKLRSKIDVLSARSSICRKLETLQLPGRKCNFLLLPLPTCLTHDAADERTVKILEEHGAAAALQLSVGHDGNAVTQQVGFIHEVRRQNHRTTGALTLQDVPGLTTSFRVHPGRRFIQDHELDNML